MSRTQKLAESVIRFLLEEDRASNDGELIAALQYALVAAVKMSLAGQSNEMVLASITATTAQALGLVKHEDTLAIVRSFMPTQKVPS